MQVSLGSSRTPERQDGEQPWRNFFGETFFRMSNEQNKATGVARTMKGDLEKRTQQALVAITLSTATLVACASLLLFL